MDTSGAIVDTLLEHGIDTLFGIPGKQTLPLNEAIRDRDAIDFVMARHESAVTHQAWGYAQTSGNPAGTVVIPGPGDMLAMNGLKNALNDCVPVIHIAVETEPTLRGGDAIHETPPETYDTVVKENVLVEQPASTCAQLERAIAIAETPPTGPVRVGIPRDFLTEDVTLAQSGTYSREGISGVDERSIEEATSLLDQATAPVILAGGGVRTAGASDDLLQMAETLDAPVVTTYKGKGVISEYNDLVAGTLSGSAPPELLDCLATADVLLAVGTDFDAVTTRSWSVELPDVSIHVTVSPDDVGTGYEPAVGIVADASTALVTLEENLESTSTGRISGHERAQTVKAATRERIEPLLDDEPPLTSVRALRAIRATLPRETIVTVDAGGFRIWALNTFEASGPRSYVNPGSWASMGTGLPSGIGAKLANPDREVVVLSGDGGLMMCVHELHTAVVENIPITVVVFNNNDYAIISEAASTTFDLPEGAYNWTGEPLSFTAIAEGMGMTAVRAETPAEIQRALDARSSEEPTLVEVPTDPAEPQASNWMSE